LIYIGIYDLLISPINLDTTQKLEKSTLERVRKHGKMGDSFNSALSKVLDQLEEKLEDVTERVEDLEADIDDQEEEDE